MKDWVYLLCFWCCWMTFCHVGVVIYDRICYYVLEALVKNAKTDEDHEKVLQILLGVL